MRETWNMLPTLFPRLLASAWLHLGHCLCLFPSVKLQLSNIQVKCFLKSHSVTFCFLVQEAKQFIFSIITDNKGLKSAILLFFCMSCSVFYGCLLFVKYFYKPFKYMLLLLLPWVLKLFSCDYIEDHN